MENLMSWRIVTRAQYNAGTPNDHDLYFISDEKIIYRGTELYTKPIDFYTTAAGLPSAPALFRIYVNTDTFEGKVWNGTDWVTVIKALADTVAPDGMAPVTGKAVAEFVADQIKTVTGSSAILNGASWDPDNHILTFTKGSGDPINIPLAGLAVTLQYIPTTGALSLLDAKGDIIGDTINLDLERFVHSGEYDADNKNVILYFNDDKTDSVTIPVADLVDEYTGENTASINISIIGHKISAAVNISAEADNGLEMKADGLYVKKDESKADKDTDAVENNIAVFDTNGNPVDSGKSIEDVANSVTAAALTWKTEM